MKKLILISALLLFASNGWAECIQGNCVNGQGTRVYSEGHEYVGEHKDGKRHGQGKYTLNSGEQYIGEHKENLFDGLGIMTWPNGKQYVGEWKVGRFDEGAVTYINGNKYVGGFMMGGPSKDGLYMMEGPHGQGSWIYANGDKYVGNSFRGQRRGQGTFTYANGNQYMGRWRNDKEHGQGTYTWPDGSQYVGEWKDGKLIKQTSTKNQTSKSSNNPAYDECMELVREEERELKQTRIIVGILSLNKNNNVRKAYSDIEKEEKKIRRIRQQCICYLNKTGNCSTIYLDKDISIDIN